MSVVLLKQSAMIDLGTMSEKVSRRHRMNQLERGTVIYVYEEQDNWSRIGEANSLWASSGYLAKASATTV